MVLTRAGLKLFLVTVSVSLPLLVHGKHEGDEAAKSKIAGSSRHAAFRAAPRTTAPAAPVASRDASLAGMACRAAALMRRIAGSLRGTVAVPAPSRPSQEPCLGAVAAGVEASTQHAVRSAGPLPKGPPAGNKLADLLREMCEKHPNRRRCVDLASTAAPGRSPPAVEGEEAVKPSAAGSQPPPQRHQTAAPPGPEHGAAAGAAGEPLAAWDRQVSKPEDGEPVEREMAGPGHVEAKMAQADLGAATGHSSGMFPMRVRRQLHDHGEDSTAWHHEGQHAHGRDQQHSKEGLLERSTTYMARASLGAGVVGAVLQLLWMFT